MTARPAVPAPAREHALRGIILSDLDGTFLDSTYRPTLPARAFAELLTRWRVIWVTSRTAAEVRWLQRLLRHREDSIAENGAVCVTYSSDVASALGNARPHEEAFVSVLGGDIKETTALVESAFASVGRRVRTFSDLTPAALARRSEYRVQDAMRARQRLSSVVLTDVDITDGATMIALTTLNRQGCRVSFGHLWATVVNGSDKGSAAKKWLRAIGNKSPVIAIGDGDNDESLLRMADVPFVVRRPGSGHHPRLAGVPGARLLGDIGTRGWHEMLDLIDHEYAGGAP